MNIDIANTLFEDRVAAILESEAPLKVVQQRTKYCKWLTNQTKLLMVDRDFARDVAK